MLETKLNKNDETTLTSPVKTVLRTKLNNEQQETHEKRMASCGMKEQSLNPGKCIH